MLEDDLLLSMGDIQHFPDRTTLLNNVKIILDEIQTIISTFPRLPVKHCESMPPLDYFIFSEAQICNDIQHSVMRNADDLLGIIRGSTYITPKAESALLEIANHTVPSCWKVPTFSAGSDIRHWLTMLRTRYETLVGYVHATTPVQSLNITTFSQPKLLLITLAQHFAQKVYKSVHTSSLQAEVCCYLFIEQKQFPVVFFSLTSIWQREFSECQFD